MRSFYTGSYRIHDDIVNIVDFSSVKITCLQDLISLQKNRFGSSIEEVITQSVRTLKMQTSIMDFEDK